MSEESKKIDFGFTEVNYQEKETLVKDVFDSVASKYDVMNDFMSFGLHRLWKKNFISKITARKNSKILDLAGGTGDISFSIHKKFRSKNIENFGITLTDINGEMLEEGKNKAIDKNIIGNIDFNQVNCEEIPYEDNSFDYVTISFGIRNVTDRLKALKEIHRVLKPTGRFLCLEFSPLKDSPLKDIYDFYSFNLIPKIGSAVAGDEESYKYLVESIRKFPDANAFEQLISDAGFKKTSYEKMTGGIVCIHSGYKI